MKRILIGTTAILAATGLKIDDEDRIPVISDDDYSRLKARATNTTSKPADIPQFATRQQKRLAERQRSKKGLS